RWWTGQRRVPARVVVLRKNATIRLHPSTLPGMVVPRIHRLGRFGDNSLSPPTPGYNAGTSLVLLSGTAAAWVQRRIGWKHPPADRGSAMQEADKIRDLKGYAQAVLAALDAEPPATEDVDRQFQEIRAAAQETIRRAGAPLKIGVLGEFNAG